MDIAIGVNRKAQVTNDRVFELRKALHDARTPECDVDDGTLLRQMLDIAAKELKSANVYIGHLTTGVRLFFYGEAWPMYVSTEAGLKAAGFTGQI